jgi:hypothetical protein
MSDTLTKAALPMVIEVYSAFSGLVDGETEVEGGELVTFMTSLLLEYPEVKAYMQGYLVGRIRERKYRLGIP